MLKSANSFLYILFNWWNSMTRIGKKSLQRIWENNQEESTANFLYVKLKNSNQIITGQWNGIMIFWYIYDMFYLVTVCLNRVRIHSKCIWLYDKLLEVYGNAINYPRNCIDYSLSMDSILVVVRTIIKTNLTNFKS